MTDFETHDTGTHQRLDDKDIEIQELKDMVAKGKRVVDDFLPNIGGCVLQNYGELNEFLCEADALAKRNEPEPTTQGELL